MATSSKRNKGSKDSDKKSSKKVAEDEISRTESAIVVETAETVQTPPVEESVAEPTPVPPEPEPEPVYEEPVLTKLIVKWLTII